MYHEPSPGGPGPQPIASFAIPGPKTTTISGGRLCDKLEAQHVAVRPRLRPNHLRVLDRLVVGRRSNPQGAHMVDRHTRVDGDPKPAALALIARPEPRAGVKSSTSASRAQRRNLRRAPRCTWASAPPFGKIEASLSATGVKAPPNVSKPGNLGQCFRAVIAAKNDRVSTLQGETPRPIVGSHTKATGGGSFAHPASAVVSSSTAKAYASREGLEGTLTIQDIHQALADAGVEIYRTDARELQIAERVRPSHHGLRGPGRPER